MNPAHVIGGLAVVGTVVLLGLAIAADDSPQSLSTTGATFGPSTAVASDPTTSSTEVTSTSGTASDETSPPTLDTDAGSTSTPATDGPTTEPPPTTTDAVTSSTGPASTTTTSVPTIESEARRQLRVIVLNAGAEAGAAAFVTGVLKQTGFEPAPPRDAAGPIDITSVYFAPGKELEAADVNTVIEADPTRVIVGQAGDPIWDDVSDEADVVVLLA